MRRRAAIARGALVVILVLIFCVTGFLSYSQYTSILQTAETEVHRAAHVVATQYNWMFQAAAQALQRIEEAASESRDWFSEPHDIREIVGDLPTGLQYSLYDASGDLLYSSVLGAPRINVADRSYFQRVRNGEELLISPAVTERVTGEQVVIVARRIDRDSQFAGAATIAVSTGTLGELLAILKQPDRSVIVLVDLTGMLIARMPQVEPRDLSSTEMFQGIMGHHDGTYAYTSTIDGVRRVAGYWRLADWPVVATVGIDHKSVSSAFRDRIIEEIALLGPLLFGLAALVVWLFRLQSRDLVREMALVAEAQRNEYLVKEIQHRVKNNLQAVMSLIRLERLPAEVKEALLGRLMAMAAVHQQMYGCGGDRVSTVPYLPQLVANVVKGYGKPVDLVTDIEPLDLPGDRAMQVGLLVNELLSNAFKHGFRDRSSGRLEISLRRHEPDLIRLVVRDDGPGMDPGAATDNMGSQLIAAFVSQLFGSVSFDSPDGLTVTVDFPATVPATAETA